MSTARPAARWRRRWHRFWFRPEALGNLAIARILVALHALWLLASRDFAAMQDVPTLFWRTVPASRLWRYGIVPGQASIDAVLQLLAAVALVAVVLGVRARLASALAAVLVYHLAPMDAAIYTSTPIGRGLTLAPLALLLLSLAPCDDALAVRGAHRALAERTRDARWVLQLLRLLVVEIYLFSAVGKLERSGLAWGSAERMQLWFWWFNQDPPSVVFGTLGPWIATQPWLCGLIGMSTVAMEWAMPLALFSRRAALVLVPVALVFHVAVLFSLNIHVPEAWLVLVLVDWDALSRRSRGIRAATTPASPVATPRTPARA